MDDAIRVAAKDEVYRQSHWERSHVKTNTS